MFVSPAEGHAVEPAPAQPSARGLTTASKRRPYLLLLAALPLMPFANVTSSVPFAAWLAPALLLCFLRTRTAARGLALGFAAFYAAWCFQWRGVVTLYALAGDAFAWLAAACFLTLTILALLRRPRPALL
ncbi:MAG TPA: hypothetical protein VF591_27415 [Pyrinomonadaceae bacterium]|jgi:hypothetical protein